MNASIAQTQIATQPAPSAAVAKFLQRAPRLFIGGEWVEAQSRERISVVDPATGQEIFGPVLVAQRFEDLDDLAALANDTPYGLGASVWSNDLKAVQRLVPKIRAGTVWVNCHNLVDPNMPFGGFKQSGFGREHGRAVLDLYTELKSVCMAY